MQHPSTLAYCLEASYRPHPCSRREDYTRVWITEGGHFRGYPPHTTKISQGARASLPGSEILTWHEALCLYSLARAGSGRAKGSGSDVGLLLHGYQLQSLAPACESAAHTGQQSPQHSHALRVLASSLWVLGVWHILLLADIFVYFRVFFATY